MTRCRASETVPQHSAAHPAPDQGLPAAHHLPGRPGVRSAHREQQPAHGALSDFNQPNNSKAGFSAGTEFIAQNLGGSAFSAALRGSYSYFASNNVKPATLSTALSDEENLQGLAAGGGLMYGSGNFNLSVDYAYKYMGILGATHFVSFGLGW